MKFIHFQPVFFDKICKKGLRQKITHEWLQTWRQTWSLDLRVGEEVEQI